MNTIKTVIRAYRFDIRNKEEKAAWLALRDSLKAQGLRLMESHGGASHWLNGYDGVSVDLETAHLFDNQWNTAPIPGKSETGLRVFDWALDYKPNGSPDIKRGHYLEQTEEMRQVRADRIACGYCGKQAPASSGLKFCPHCIGSEYLKSSDLHLTRMRGVTFAGSRAPLTPEELAERLPLCRDAQINGNTERDKKRIAAKRADIESKYRKAVDNATTERDGFTWLMDRGINTADVIYYSHTGRFGFGWRGQGVDAELLSPLLDVISEFPFPYDITCADGRKLSGN